MAYRGRFAPSPTGPLHFGSLVAAVASWCDARSANGTWLVRMEDVDAARTVPGAADAILKALEAFGLGWDGEVAWQSRRTGLYESALARLDRLGATYRCRCSRKEIADSGLAGLEGPVYPGTCRELGISTTVPGADRVRTGSRTIAFDDRAQGRIAQSIEREIGDFVLRRRDGLFAYQLAVVVDDADQDITEVVRGADLLLSTPRQIHLQRLLGLSQPRYLHVPVATNALGQKLSKQTLAPALSPAQVSRSLQSALAFLGQARVEPSAPEAMLRQAASQWNPGRVPRRRSREMPGV